jgi:hypothetical protein
MLATGKPKPSTALAWLIYAKVDLVSLILCGGAMQGKTLFRG